MDYHGKNELNPTKVKLHWTELRLPFEDQPVLGSVKIIHRYNIENASTGKIECTENIWELQTDNLFLTEKQHKN